MNVELEHEGPGVYHFVVEGQVSASYDVSCRFGKWWCECHNFVMSKNKNCKHIKACKEFLELRD